MTRYQAEGNKGRWLVVGEESGKAEVGEERGWDGRWIKTRFIGTNEVGSNCNTDAV